MWNCKFRVLPRKLLNFIHFRAQGGPEYQNYIQIITLILFFIVDNSDEFLRVWPGNGYLSIKIEFSVELCRIVLKFRKRENLMNFLDFEGKGIKI